MQIDVDPTMVSTDDPDQVGTAWDEAIAADRPCVLAARTRKLMRADSCCMSQPDRGISRMKEIRDECP